MHSDYDLLKDWDLLSNLVTQLRHAANIVEVGCEYGQSTLHILKSMPANAVLHIIDPFESPDVASQWINMARKTGKPFTLHVMKTEQTAIQLPWDLIHIDGDHSRESILIDLDRIVKHAAPGALACFHDWDVIEAVKITVSQWMIQDLSWHFHDQVESLAVWKKSVETTLTGCTGTIGISCSCQGSNY